jgi:MoaA/NifB/PqqE/SkfB family radical SAM enzyme
MTPPVERFATVDEQGRLVLPAAVARQFGFVPGEQVYLDLAEHTVRLHRPLSNLARIYLEPTTRCNMDCEMCQRQGWPEGTGDMTPEIFARILESIEACQPPPTVVLGGFGEPLLHGRTMAFIEQCKERGAGVELITNGLLLDADRIQILRRLKLDRLWLSVDGGAPGAHGHCMRQETLAELVQTLWRMNTVHHFPLGNRLRLGLVFVAMKDNLHELPRVLELARQLEADKLLISNLLPYAAEMTGEILYKRSSWNMGSGILQVRIPRMDSGEKVASLLGQAVRSRGIVDLLDREYEEPFNTCPFVNTGSVSIRWDGGVSPCLPLLHTHVSFLGEVARQNRECLFGSLRDQSLLEIWKRPEYVEFRKSVYQFDFPPCVSCGTCELAEHNEEDCFGNPFPTCGGCLWAQGFIICP